MILLRDGDFAILQSPETILMFSFSSSGFDIDDTGVIALDDNCEVIDNYRVAMSRLADFAKFHPDAEYMFSYDGDRTIMIVGGVALYEIADGYLGPYGDPIEAYTEADEIRTARLRAASEGG